MNLVILNSNSQKLSVPKLAVISLILIEAEFLHELNIAWADTRVYSIILQLLVKYSEVMKLVRSILCSPCLVFSSIPTISPLIWWRTWAESSTYHFILASKTISNSAPIVKDSITSQNKVTRHIISFEEITKEKSISKLSEWLKFYCINIFFFEVFLLSLLLFQFDYLIPCSRCW